MLDGTCRSGRPKINACSSVESEQSLNSSIVGTTSTVQKGVMAQCARNISLAVCRRHMNGAGRSVMSRRRASTKTTFQMEKSSSSQDALRYYRASASQAAMRLMPLQPGNWKPQTAWFVATIPGAAGCALASRPEICTTYRRLQTGSWDYSRTHTVQSVPWMSLLSVPPHSSCPRREQCQRVIALLPHWVACTSAEIRMASVF